MAELAAFAAYMRGLRDGMFGDEPNDGKRRRMLADHLGLSADRLYTIERGASTTMHERRGMSQRLGLGSVMDLEERWRGNVRHMIGTTDEEYSTRRIPIMNLTPAGEPCDFAPWGENPGTEARMYIDAPPEVECADGTFGLIVFGDSMEDTWCDGDLVICRSLGPRDEQPDGTPCFIRTADGDCTFKCIYRDLDAASLELRPANGTHRSQFIPMEEVKQVAVAIHTMPGWLETFGSGSFSPPAR
ncbi:MAG: S24 family peptidase [Planctomycetota bacterium]